MGYFSIFWLTLLFTYSRFIEYLSVIVGNSIQDLFKESLRLFVYTPIIMFGVFPKDNNRRMIECQKYS